MLLPGLMNIQPANTASINTANMISPAIAISSSALVRDRLERAASSCGYQLELGIAERAHFRQI